MKNITLFISILFIFSCRTTTKNDNSAIKDLVVENSINNEIKNNLYQNTHFNIPENLKKYYSNIYFSKNKSELFDQLATLTISNHTVFLSYRDRHKYLYHIDEDLNNKSNVILIYSSESRPKNEYMSVKNYHKPQTFNTEHIYPQSKIENTAKGDLHHLRTCDHKLNSKRSHYSFTDGNGKFKLINKNSWYPGDEWKGDVARMIMYLHLRYNEPFNQIGNLNLFIKWNIEDPVSKFEERRNNRIEKAQGNRNPFIDNPYLATLIWGGQKAQNKWSN